MSLFLKNRLPRDGEIALQVGVGFGGHSYVRRDTNERAPLSVTTVVKSQFPKFDADRCFDEFFMGWKYNASHKYYSVIQKVMQKGGNDAEAQRAIQAQWREEGRVTSDAGTKLHNAIELHANGMDTPESEDLVTWKRWWDASGLEAVRSELVTFVETPDGALALAGCADMLATDKSGRHVLLDWKRSKKNLTSEETAFRDAKGLEMCTDVPDTDYYKYSLQLSLYNRMLVRTQGVDCGDRMFVVNVHPGNDGAVEAKAFDLRSIADRLIDARVAQVEAGSAKRQRT
jgi:hypothetical protein